MASPFPGMDPYLERPGLWPGVHKKRSEVLASNANLVEIDLLRGGELTVAVVSQRRGHSYHVVVSRAERRGEREVYAFGLRDRLPRVAVPLVPGIPDVVLDLPGILAETHEKGRYGESLYERPLVPPLEPEDAAWARERSGAK